MSQHGRKDEEGDAVATAGWEFLTALARPEWTTSSTPPPIRGRVSTIGQLLAHALHVSETGRDMRGRQFACHRTVVGGEDTADVPYRSRR